MSPIRWRARGRVVSWPDRPDGVPSYLAPPRLAATPCAAPTRPARSVSGFWIRLVNVYMYMYMYMYMCMYMYVICMYVYIYIYIYICLAEPKTYGPLLLFQKTRNKFYTCWANNDLSSLPRIAEESRLGLLRIHKQIEPKFNRMSDGGTWAAVYQRRLGQFAAVGLQSCS